MSKLILLLCEICGNNAFYYILNWDIRIKDREIIIKWWQDTSEIVTHVKVWLCFYNLLLLIWERESALVVVVTGMAIPRLISSDSSHDVIGISHPLFYVWFDNCVFVCEYVNTQFRHLRYARSIFLPLPHHLTAITSRYHLQQHHHQHHRHIQEPGIANGIRVTINAWCERGTFYPRWNHDNEWCWRKTRIRKLNEVLGIMNGIVAFGIV